MNNKNTSYERSKESLKEYARNNYYSNNGKAKYKKERLEEQK